MSDRYEVRQSTYNPGVFHVWDCFMERFVMAGSNVDHRKGGSEHNEIYAASLAVAAETC